MATATKNPVPENLTAVTPQFWFNGNCRQAISFYKKALGAELDGDIVDSPDGNFVWHAILRIGNAAIMVADALPGGVEVGPGETTTMSIMLYVNDCDAVWTQAMRQGCTEISPMDDMFWGDRMGKLQDPYGHVWAIASHQWLYSPEEMQKKQDEMLTGMGGGYTFNI